MENAEKLQSADQPKKLKRGGSRKGKRNKASLGARIKYMGEPDAVDYLVKVMRYWHGRANRVIEGAGGFDKATMLTGDAFEVLKEAFDKLQEALKLAAPYFRPQLSAVKVNVGVRLDLTKATDLELEAIERLVERTPALPGGNPEGEDQARH